ncbi:Rha family transcriptional regulator [Chimaeribacter californicus]|uniref:Rha family transcriptional regulator n=1 Tax=Chimaeribacter californicus TaxID=2060067 RepID=A0A2N5EDW8_9GAMM|nr:Rha family transcriptional regulator [Chimaeribacter californicus]PLR40728.1 Rha family transcriptional regulator [Chimaeribacter californicus]
MNNPSVIPAFNFHDMVMPSGDRVVTTSLKVAEYFGKAHKNVLRAIKRLEGECSPDFSRLNFEPVEYLDRKGEMRLMYSITKDGWMMLVMGFTGKAATAIKESYISAFNWMTTRLIQRQAMGEELQHRFAIKETRSKLKGTIGSRLMNERKKEKRVLAVEHDHIMQIAQPGLLFNDERPDL